MTYRSASHACAVHRTYVNIRTFFIPSASINIHYWHGWNSLCYLCTYSYVFISPFVYILNLTIPAQGLRVFVPLRGKMPETSTELIGSSDGFTLSKIKFRGDIIIHSVFCLTTGPKPPPKRFLHIVRSRASSFKWYYPLLSLKSSNSFVRLLLRLLVTSISPFIFPSITCFRRQFLLKMWPTQLKQSRYRPGVAQRVPES